MALQPANDDGVHWGIARAFSLIAPTLVSEDGEARHSPLIQDGHTKNRVQNYSKGISEYLTEMIESSNKESTLQYGTRKEFHYDCGSTR